MENALSSCTTTSCLCSATVEGIFATCMNCIVSLDPTPETVAAAQQGIDEFVSTCPSDNFGLPTPTISIGAGSAFSFAAGPPPPLSSTPTRGLSSIADGTPPASRHHRHQHEPGRYFGCEY